MSELNIFQRLSKITEELGFVKKGLDVRLQTEHMLARS